MTTILSWAQIYSLTRSVGCTEQQGIVATAITAPESSRNPSCYYVSDVDRSYGLWQINMIGKTGTARSKQFNLPSYDSLLDPVINARAMYAISSHGSNFSPWSTFGDGKYKPYLSAAEQAAETVGNNWASYLPGAIVPVTKHYIVKTGDTVSKIAKAYNLSVEKLISLNPVVLQNPNVIYPGSTLVVG